MRFVEEVLRHSTVVHIRARHTVVDSVIDGVAIAAGERVIAVNAAANRDPSRWERPAEIVPERSRLFSHLAFNVGPRHCAGAHIARMEAGEAIPALFRAFPDLARPAGVDGSAVQPIGFVSRAWRPIDLVHEPVAATIARQRILDGAFRTGEAAEAGTAGGDEGPPSGRGPGGYG